MANDNGLRIILEVTLEDDELEVNGEFAKTMRFYNDYCWELLNKLGLPIQQGKFLAPLPPFLMLLHPQKLRISLNLRDKK